MTSTQVHWLHEGFTTWERNGLIICQMTFMSNCPTVPLSTWLKCGFLKNGGTPKSPWVSICFNTKIVWSWMIWGSHEENSKSKLPSSPSPGDATCQICQFHQEKAVTGCDPMAFWCFFVWSTVHDGNSYAATFRHALGCCSWEQCWMNLLERVSQKYDRQLVELTEPFAWRKWSNIVGKAKAVTTYYNLLQPITTSEHDQKNVLDLVSPACHRNGMAYVSWICQLHRQGACHKSD